MTDALIETDSRAPGDKPAGPGRRGAASEGGASSPSGRLRPGRWAAELIERGRGRLEAMTGVDWFTALVTLAVVAACALFVFFMLQPRELFSDTTPTGGDMSAHVWAPAYLRDHLLPKGRLTGWTPDWYAGFPAFQFYMVPPFLAIALLSYVIPYGVAFKLVAVSGCVSLPIMCWAFGRLNRLPFPAPALLAVGATIFLFDRSFSIYGGNIASTLAGEFSFSISLSLGILYLGVLGRYLATGRHRGWVALLLALSALCHVIPALFVALATLIWLVVRPGRAAVAYLVTVAPVAALLVAWWFLPFYGRSGYLNDMGWEKLTTYTNLLYSRQLSDGTLSNYPDLRFMLALAVVGLVVSLLMRQRAGLFLGLTVLATALAFRLAPETRLWNARILPFYYLSVYLLAMLGLALVFVAFARWFAERDRPLEVGLAAFGTATVCLIVYVFLALPMQALPFGHVEPDGTYTIGLGPWQRSVKESSFLKSWVDWNFNGLEAVDRPLTVDAEGNEVEGPPKYDRAYPEFYDLIKTLETVSRDHGCGRAMWEYEEQHNRYGSTMEPMMLPFFTDGCIGSMEGLYFEASATTPYHFINSTQLSRQGSAPQRELPYATMPPNQADFDQGVQHLQLLGVKYYLAIDDLMKERAGANPDLVKRADSGPWAIYEVKGSELVVGLPAQPAVLTGQATTGTDWLHTSACWYVNPDTWTVPLVADGPADWQRVHRTVSPDPKASAQEKCSSPDGSPWGWFDSGGGPETREEPPVKVSSIQAGDDSISFDVDRTGVPVLVKTSYFPNWKVSGAEGVYRATPNLMVVIPTANHVELHYGYTGLDLVSYALTALGIVGLVLLFRLPAVRVRPAGPYWGAVEDPEHYPAARLNPIFAGAVVGTGAVVLVALARIDGDWLGTAGPWLVAVVYLALGLAAGCATAAIVSWSHRRQPGAPALADAPLEGWVGGPAQPEEGPPADPGAVPPGAVPPAAAGLPVEATIGDGGAGAVGGEEAPPEGEQSDQGEAAGPAADAREPSGEGT